MNFYKKTIILIILIFLIKTDPLTSGGELPADEIFLKKAAEYYHQKKLDMAIKLYLQILENDPYNLNALINIGAAFIKKGSFSDAYPYIKRLVTKFPNRSEGWINLAICEIGLRKLKDALKHLNIAEKRFDCPEFCIYLHKGIIYSKLGKLEKALEFYNKAELLKPDDPVLIFDLALLYEKKGDCKNALLYYQRYMKRWGTSISPGDKADMEKKIYVLQKLCR